MSCHQDKSRIADLSHHPSQHPSEPTKPSLRLTVRVVAIRPIPTTQIPRPKTAHTRRTLAITTIRTPRRARTGRVCRRHQRARPTTPTTTARGRGRRARIKPVRGVARRVAEDAAGGAGDVGGAKAFGAAAGAGLAGDEEGAGLKGGGEGLLEGWWGGVLFAVLCEGPGEEGEE